VGLAILSAVVGLVALVRWLLLRRRAWKSTVSE
jgi:hypothetical protein